jgi:hypothetical protein
MIFNYIYNFLVIRLNKFVNHKYRSKFDNSLISKIFIFQFVNSFNSLFIIAFIKKYIPELGGCLKKVKMIIDMENNQNMNNNQSQINNILSTSNYCDEEVSNQLLIIALINFLKNFSEVKYFIKTI